MTIDTNELGAAASAKTARHKRQRPSAKDTIQAAEQLTTVTAAKPPSKSALVIKLLSRARGATSAEIGEPTGWQPHSVRSYLTGLRKKGRSIIREQRKSGETVYRIDASSKLAPAEAATPSGDAGEAALPSDRADVGSDAAARVA